MRIGVAKEIEDNENRVGLTAEGAAELVAAGRDVSVERRWCMNQKYGSGASLPQGSSSIHCRSQRALAGRAQPFDSGCRRR